MKICLNFKNISIIFLLLTTSVIVGFLISELASRLVFPVRLPHYVDEDGKPYCFLIPDQELHHRNKANFRGKLVATEFEHGVRTNSLGFRGSKEFSVVKNGKFRIFGLGDSFTFGYGVKEDESYLTLSEKMLNDSLNIPIEIVNLGVEATGTLQQIGLFHQFLYLQPDLVILGFFARDMIAATGGNDLIDNYIHYNRMNEKKNGISAKKVVWKNESLFRKVRTYLRRNSNLYKIVELYLGGYLRKNYTPQNNPELHRKAWKITRETLINFDRTLDDLNIRCILLWIPFPNEVADQNSSVAEKIEHLELENITVLNPILAFNDNPEKYYYKADCHWNAEGHKLAAELLFKEIINHEAFKVR